MTIVKSPSMDPAENFALERELLTERTGDFLLLYVNSPCVVVGRNQCPEAEADLEYCAREKIPVLRRISGGGTVYHDEGNVNWAFVTEADATAPLDRRPLALVAAALRGMGVETVAGVRGELTVEGKKVSGTASCVRRGRRLFHGTLLWDADLGTMRRALAGDAAKRGRWVASMVSPVANLKQITGRSGTAAEFMNDFARQIASLRE